MASDEQVSTEPVLTQRLLLTVVEQLKMPLMNIARLAELGDPESAGVNVDTIRVTADSALQLLDNYLLGVQLASRQLSTFETEPVSVAAVLHDAGNQLRPLAKA